MLKSILSLEHVVRKRLEGAGFHARGAFFYVPTNEHGNRIEFSGCAWLEASRKLERVAQLEVDPVSRAKRFVPPTFEGK